MIQRKESRGIKYIKCSIHRKKKTSVLKSFVNLTKISDVLGQAITVGKESSLVYHLGPTD